MWARVLGAAAGGGGSRNGIQTPKVVGGLDLENQARDRELGLLWR